MSPLHQTPRGGLGHRVFEKMGPVDQVVAAFAFEPPLDDAQLARVQAILDRWSSTVPRDDAEEPAHSDEPFLSPRGLRVQVHNLVDPKAALEALTRELELLSLREAHFGRWAPVRGSDELGLVVDPTAPEELTHFPKHEDYLRAVFDLAEDPPASEYASQGNGAFETRTGDIVVEERGMPLHLPPLRIAYGAAKAGFTAPDARATEVAAALKARLEAAFVELAGARPPRFFDHTGNFGQVDRLELSHRVGYGFAFASPELVQRLSATRYRYREHELFELVLQLSRELDLAPIVTWQRFGKPFAREFRTVDMHVFQLWEPGRPLDP